MTVYVGPWRVCILLCMGLLWAWGCMCHYDTSLTRLAIKIIEVNAGVELTLPQEV